MLSVSIPHPPLSLYGRRRPHRAQPSSCRCFICCTIRHTPVTRTPHRVSLCVCVCVSRQMCRVFGVFPREPVSVLQLCHFLEGRVWGRTLPYSLPNGIKPFVIKDHLSLSPALCLSLCGHMKHTPRGFIDLANVLPGRVCVRALDQKLFTPICTLPAPSVSYTNCVQMFFSHTPF